MPAKVSGPAAERYKILRNQVKELLDQTNIRTDFTNIGYLLASKGLIKEPKLLYSNIEEKIIYAIIEAKLKGK